MEIFYNSHNTLQFVPCYNRDSFRKQRKQALTGNAVFVQFASMLKECNSVGGFHSSLEKMPACVISLTFKLLHSEMTDKRLKMFKVEL